MRAIVIGSAAGGGFPQWNCACANCSAARRRKAGFVPRTQDSLAIEQRGRIVLVNASPDVLSQIQRTPALWPRSERHSPIAAVVLTNGDLDHVLGLFSLRERHPFVIYATAAVWSGIAESAFVTTLQRFPHQLTFVPLPLDEPVALHDAAGDSLDIAVRAIPVPGKPPLHRAPSTASLEDNIGLEILGERRLVYASTCADAVELAADVLLFDGTFYRDDELPRLGLGDARAATMAHVPIESSLHLGRGRRIYTHIHNSNPILDPFSAEKRAVKAAGWEVAYDGMEIPL